MGDWAGWAMFACMIAIILVLAVEITKFRLEQIKDEEHYRRLARAREKQAEPSSPPTQSAE